MDLGLAFPKSASVLSILGLYPLSLFVPVKRLKAGNRRMGNSRIDARRMTVADLPSIVHILNLV
jgi:hypothetical protein